MPQPSLNIGYRLLELNLEDGDYTFEAGLQGLLIGGTVHLAVGAGYPETGSRNQSGVHWDFICDMQEESEFVVDGELFYRNGQFQV